MDLSYEILAEVSVGLAGFAGLIVAIRSRNDPLPHLQLVGFLQNCLTVLLLSLVAPFFVEIFENDAYVYRWLCGALAVYHAYIAFAYDRSQRRFSTIPWYQKLILILTIPVILLKVAAAFGFFLEHIGQVFYFALLWHLMVAVYIFANFLMLTTEESDASWRTSDDT